MKLAAMLAEGPAAHGWDEDQRWTGARGATLIGRKFHGSYSPGAAGRLMRRLGFTKTMTQMVATRDGLTVVLLPLYAPDLNPAEGVWSHLKRSLANLAAIAVDRPEALAASGSSASSTVPRSSTASSRRPA